MTIHLPKVNQFGGGNGGGGGSSSFPTIVTDSGSSLPVDLSGFEWQDTFLNTSDKKIYKAKADGYELNTNAEIYTITTTPLTIDYSSGVASGFALYYGSGGYQLTCLLKKRLSSDFAWAGEKEYKIHFKRNSTGSANIRYLLFATASKVSYSLTKYIGVQIINSKLYISEISGSSEDVAPFMLVDYELEANKEYYIKLSKKSNGKIETTIYENGYDQTMLATNIVDNQIEDITPMSATETTLWCGAFWRGTDNSLGIGFNGDIYLLDTTGDFLKASSELSWDSGTSITDKTEYADKTNGALYLYENSELVKIPQNKIFTDVYANSWVADSTYADYGYKCEITNLNGVTSNMFAQVIFAPAQADSGNYATVCLTGNGTVTIYSKVNDTISIPSIVVMGV